MTINGRSKTASLLELQSFRSSEIRWAFRQLLSGKSEKLTRCKDVHGPWFVTVDSSFWLFCCKCLVRQQERSLRILGHWAHWWNWALYQTKGRWWTLSFFVCYPIQKTITTRNDWESSVKSGLFCRVVHLTQKHIPQIPKQQRSNCSDGQLQIRFSM